MTTAPRPQSTIPEHARCIAYLRVSTEDQAREDSVSLKDQRRECEEFARRKGRAALRELSFAERAERLKAMSKALHAQRDELIALSVENTGTTAVTGLPVRRLTSRPVRRSRAGFWADRARYQGAPGRDRL